MKELSTEDITNQLTVHSNTFTSIQKTNQIEMTMAFIGKAVVFAALIVAITGFPKRTTPSGGYEDKVPSAVASIASGGYGDNAPTIPSCPEIPSPAQEGSEGIDYGSAASSLASGITYNP